MTRNQLAKEVSVSEKLLLSTTIQAIEGTVRVIKETLAKGEPVFLRGFGTFQPIDVPERHAHNFTTGKLCVIPPHKSVKFRVSKDLVLSLNAETGKEANV